VSSWIVWFIAAFGLLIAELLTGTFYLMVIAAALAAGGLASLAGASFSVQLLLAAVLGFGGALLLRNSRFGKAGNSGDTMQHLDVGRSLRIDAWESGGTARANYRGAQWDVELAPGESAEPGEFVIRAVDGNRLIVAARKVPAG
jgi:membrane protein implicated in regulation of membrane protease activity